METREGIVSNSRFSTEVTGSDRSSSTSQIAIFDLDGKPVELKLPDSMVINNGDKVVAAGHLKRGLLKAYAYRNETKSVTGKNIVYPAYFGGIIFSLVGWATITTLGIFFIMFGVSFLYYGYRNGKAYSMVKNHKF